MFKNYFKTAWRSLWKNKFYTLINISGLSVGLATAIMLLLWVENELSFDKFHKDYKDIYELSSHFPSNGTIVTWEWVPGPLAVYAKSIPQVQSIVRTGAQPDQIISTKDKSKMLDGNVAAYVDTNFLSVFNFELLQGDKKTVFHNNNSVVLTQKLAQKLFGNENALGKIIHYSGSNFTVTGVLQNFPVNSSILYDAIFPMGFYGQQFTASGGNGDWKTIDEDLGDYAFNTFVKLQPNTDPVKVGDAFSAAYKKARNGDSNTSFQLENIGDIHLVSADGNNSALKMVRIFMLVVILLLAIATINYVNLSTARSLIRAKEVSIRKIIGAKKQQLFLQFITETFIVFCCAIVIAGMLIYLLMPLYNEISGKDLSFSLTDISVCKAAGLAIAGTLIASGIYPALLLSSFNPIQSLKGKITSGIGVNTMRKVLVVFQFAISVVLLVCTIIMSSQMRFIKNTDVGYDKSYVFNVPLTQGVIDHAEAVKTELLRQPGILNVSTSDAYDITEASNGTGDLDWPGKPVNTTLYITQVDADKDFIPTLKIKFLEGTNFSGTPSDSLHFIFNETAVKDMGLKPPYVGQQVSLHDWKGTILGVVKDFNFKSLKEKVSPLIFFSRYKGDILYVRTNAASAQQAIAATQKQYKKYSSNIPFSYNFLDKSFEAHYKSEQHAGLLFNVFAGIAIFISCLGLFGLATYTAQAKVKEIGIRKVLGASIPGIIALISKDFLKLVIISVVIATPVAWWAMNKWLEGFAYKINISWWVFAIAGIVALLIAVLTVSFQAIKAAIANPVKSLRTE